MVRWRSKTWLIGIAGLLVGVLCMVIGAGGTLAQEVRKMTYAPLTGGAEPRDFTLFMPRSGSAVGRVPAVVMVHGTVGIRRNNSWYRHTLLRAGIAVAQVDFRSGIYTGMSNRPDRGYFQPYAFGVLRALRRAPGVDPDRIAIMGFSMGGWITLLAAFDEWRREMIGDEPPFAAHVAIYAACAYLYPKKMTGKPILMIHGMDDEFAPEHYCSRLRNDIDRLDGGLVQYKVYNGVNHRFDWWPVPSRSNRWWDEKTARDSRQRVTAFLKNAFGISSAQSPGRPMVFERKQKGPAQNPTASGFLTGEQIKKVLVGNTFQYETGSGRTIATYLARDGGSFYRAPSGREVKKRWWVEGAGVLCRTVGPRNREKTLCFKVSRGAQADHVSLYRRNGSPLFLAKILNGKQISR